MYKLIIYDITGVLFKSESFSIQLSKFFDVPYESIIPFFKEDLQECIVGKADLKEKIKPWLDKWSWKGDVDSLLQFWFRIEDSLNVEVLQSAILLREKGYKIIIATHQEKYRMEYIRKVLKLEKVFEKIYASCELGMKKTSPEFFKRILNDYNVEPAQVLLVDDKKENIEAAKSLGIDAILVKNNTDYFDKVNEL